MAEVWFVMPAASEKLFAATETITSPSAVGVTSIEYSPFVGPVNWVAVPLVIMTSANVRSLVVSLGVSVNRTGETFVPGAADVIDNEGLVRSLSSESELLARLLFPAVSARTPLANETVMIPSASGATSKVNVWLSAEVTLAATPFTTVISATSNPVMTSPKSRMLWRYR